MAIDVTSPSGLTGGRNFMGQNYSPNRVGTSDVVRNAQEILDNPSAYAASQGALVGQQVPFMDPNNPNMQGDQVNYGPTNQFNIEATTGTTAANNNLLPNAPTAQTGYQSTSVTNAINQTGTQAEAAQGEISQGGLVNVDETQIDTSTGANAELDQVVTYNTSTILDTSTPAGKLVARDLGQFGFVDSKRTITGQLKILQGHFVDPNTGEYKIPPFMADVANAIKGSLNIKGASPQQITAKLATAMMSNLVGIADKEATIQNTIASENMNAKNTQLINKARILSQFKIANADSKTKALLQNSTNIVRMDLQNLGNRQQANILDASNRYLALFEDAKEENLAKRFDITNELDREQWYETLNTNVGLRIAEMKDAMTRTNIGEINAAERANAQLEQRMFEFEKTHQFQIDQDNLNYRRAITTANTEMAFQAAQFDAKAMLSLTSEAHNRLWNRADMQFNYLAQAAENQKDRDLKMFQMKMEAQLAAMQAKAQKKAGLFGALGKIGGSVLGSMFGQGGVMAAGGAGWGALATGAKTLMSFLPFSDAELKDNVRRIGTHNSGLPLYKWDWNKLAKELGADEFDNVGVMAHEAQKKFPEAVYTHPNGYMTVNYARLQ